MTKAGQLTDTCTKPTEILFGDETKKGYKPQRKFGVTGNPSSLSRHKASDISLF